LPKIVCWSHERLGELTAFPGPSWIKGRENMGSRRKRRREGKGREEENGMEVEGI